MTQHYLFISAHLDDAILSCGDYIHALIQNNYQVTIATVFTGMGTDLSMLARILHKNSGWEWIRWMCAGKRIFMLLKHSVQL
ncbi:PIG-L family deacetylase [Paenibacillus rhizoplanae]